MIVLVVVAAAIVAEVVGLAGLTLLEDVEAVVPGRNIFCQVTEGAAIVTIIVVVVIIVVAITCVHTLDDLNGIQVSGMLNRTRRVSVETERHTAFGKGLHVVVYVVPFSVCLARLGAATGPGLAIVLHELVLVFGPDAGALVLVELFHPIVVVRLLEETEELKVGIMEMTIILGATAAVLVCAGGFVPLAGVVVEKLILTNATPFVVEINVLQN